MKKNKYLSAFALTLPTLLCCGWIFQWHSLLNNSQKLSSPLGTIYVQQETSFDHQTASRKFSQQENEKPITEVVNNYEPLVFSKEDMTPQLVRATTLSEETTPSVLVKKKQPHLFLSTGRLTYQPKQKLPIRLIAMEKDTFSPLGQKEVFVGLENAQGISLLQTQVVLSPTGRALCRVEIPERITSGEYFVYAKLGRTKVRKKIAIRYYVKPRVGIAIKFS